MLHLWQLPSALAGISLTQVIGSDIDLEPIVEEVARADELAAFTRQAGPYHNGKWNRIGLISPSGDPNRTYPVEGERREKTPVLRAMPSLGALLSRFDGEIRTASLSRMEPGAHVRWHRDGRQSIDLSYARLHLPIVTSPEAVMGIGHQRLHLTAGQLWYADFSFPHEVRNTGPRARIHLMFDVSITDKLLKQFPEAFLRQKPRRKLARAAAARIFDLRERIHPEGRRALQARAERDRAMARGELQDAER